MEVNQSAVTISSWPKSILKGTLGLSSQQFPSSSRDAKTTYDRNAKSRSANFPAGGSAVSVQVRECFNFADCLSSARDVVDDQKLAEWFRGRAAAIRNRIAELSPRERQIMFLIAHGHSNKQTAVSMSVSVKTVEKYRRSLCKKLDVTTSAELAYLITAADLHCGLPGEPEG
jgi:DNA-binding CsgD family transcriptional regulator